MKNKPLFYGKRYVVLWKTSRRFMKSEPLFCAKYPIFFLEMTDLRKKERRTV